MNSKDVLLDFISRYHLDGKIENAVIHLRDGNTRTEAFNGGEQVYCDINMRGSALEDENVDLTIADTNSFVRMLRAFEDPDIKIYYNEKNMNDRDPHSVIIEENNIRSNFLLAVSGVVQPHGKKLNSNIDGMFEITIDEEFIQKFNKFKFLLKDESRSFSFFERDGEVILLFGINRLNGSNNVAINTGIQPNEHFREEIIYPIDTFYSILKNNEDADITVKVRSGGMIVHCLSENFENTYALASMKNKQA